MTNEITDSLIKNLNKRLTTPLYGTFLVSWVVFHWKAFVILLFVSEDKIWQSTGLLKSDYLCKIVYNFQSIYFYISWIAPFILTYFVIWKFSKWFSLPAFIKEEEHRTAKKLVRIHEQKKIEMEETNLEKESIKKLEVVSEKTKKQEEILKSDPTISWLEEYKNFFKKYSNKDFNPIIESLYQHRGYIRMQNFEIPKEILAYAHSSGLINIDYGSNKIDLTDKGKFFVKNFTLNP